MRILVTGAKGQVAAALLRAGARRDGINVTVLGRPDLDLERPSRAAIVRESPDVVVNAAAFALAAALVPGFSVASFWAALFGALVVSLVSWFVGAFLAG